MTAFTRALPVSGSHDFRLGENHDQSRKMPGVASGVREKNYGTAPQVIVDGLNLLKGTGTGIASYSRTLTTTLRTLGCCVAVLYGRRWDERTNDGSLSLATQVFGNEPPSARWQELLSNIPYLVRIEVGGGRRARCLEVPMEGVDRSSHEPPLPVCDQVLNSNNLFERAHWLFALKQRFMTLDVPSSTKAMHWTAPLSIKARGVPNIYTLHDLIPVQFPRLVIDKGGRSVRLHTRIAREADHIITVSEASKRQIVELLHVPDERVSVTYQPVPEQPEIAQDEAERLVETIYGAKPGAYAFFAGAIEPKKNLKRLIEAYAQSGAGIPLLIAGPLGWLYDDDLALIETIGNSARGDGPLVRRLGYIPRRHLVALLQCARFFVFPSICEGFGLPVLEAMKLGIPVITSNTTSLPEVAGDAATLIDPLNVAELANAIRTMSNDADLRLDLSKRGPLQAAKFSQASYAQRLMCAYQKAGVEIGDVHFIHGCLSEA